MINTAISPTAENRAIGPQLRPSLTLTGATRRPAVFALGRVPALAGAAFAPAFALVPAAARAPAAPAALAPAPFRAGDAVRGPALSLVDGAESEEEEEEASEGEEEEAAVSEEVE